MKKMISYGFLLAVIAFMASCTKDPLRNMTEEESRIYITNYDSSVDFGSYSTFSIVDSVAIIDDNRFAGAERSSWDAAFLSALADIMKARGYVQVPRSNDPDLGINVSRLYNTYSGIISYPDYWGGYGGYYDPYYWGYSGYPYYFPPRYGVYQVTEGAMSVDMLDLKNSESTNRIAGIWTGLIRGSGIFNSSSIQSQVNALFEQSPYLRTP